MIQITEAQAGEIFLYVDMGYDECGEVFWGTEALVFIRQRDNRCVYTDIIASKYLPMLPVFSHETLFERRVTPLDFPLYLNYRKKTDTFDKILSGENLKDLTISLPTNKTELFSFQKSYRNNIFLQIVRIKK